MVLGLSLRVSWICLLLLSSAACFPATKGDYKYPYTNAWGASGGAHQSGGLRSPLVSLQYEAAPQQPSSPSGNQSPSSVGAPNVAAGSSPRYEPNRFIVTYDPSSNKLSSAPAVPSGNTGFVSPPVGPAGTGKKAPRFPVQPQPAGTSRNPMGSNMGLSRPVYEAPSVPPPSGSAYPAGNTATTYDFGYRPARYAAAPTTYDSGDVLGPYAAATADLGDGPVPYGNPSSPGLPWDEQPSGGAYGSFPDPSAWMPSRAFPDFSAWDAKDEMPRGVSETSPLPPSSYIIQSRNGYQRAREILSHLKYSPEYPEPPVFPYEAAKAPSQSPPESGSKGGNKGDW